MTKRIKFELDDVETANAKTFAKKHIKKCKLEYPEFTYKFTNTGIGTAVVVECNCGKQKDVTNYNCW